MKNRLIPCVLACLMIFLVGCNGNTAKEAAQEITKTETSFPAGNTETNSQEDTAEEPESTAVQEETPITAEECKSTAESQTVTTVQTKPAEEKTADTPATEKPKAEPPKQTTTQAEPEKQPEQPKEQTTAEQKPVEKSTEKPAEPKPTEPPKQTFDVSPYVSYAKEYAVSIGLSLDSTATECWDNPISANPNRSGIKSDIESRLNRYLKHGFDKAYTDYGCPYVQENCDMELPSDNIIIYGHHMNDGSMFAGLMKFKDKNFWEKHKTISFDTLTDRQTYEVIAVFKTVVYTDSPEGFKYYQFINAETAEDFTAYVEKCKKLSLYETGVTAEYGDKLLTLSTCEYSRTNGRLVVVAKLINE